MQMSLVTLVQLRLRESCERGRRERSTSGWPIKSNPPSSTPPQRVTLPPPQVTYCHPPSVTSCHRLSVIPCHRHRRRRHCRRRRRHRLHQMSMPPLPFGSIKRIAICFSSGDSGVVQTGASRLASQDGVGASQPRASAHEQCWKVHLQLPARSRQVLAHVHRRATDSWRSRFSAECFRLAFARDTDDEIDQPKKPVREITSGTAWHRRRRFSAW